MFQYEEVLGIKIGDKIVAPNALEENKIPLLPDYINDVLRKINGKKIPVDLICTKKEAINGYINVYEPGYAIGAINSEGKIIYFDKKIKSENILDDFYDDYLAVKTNMGMYVIFGYINGTTGKRIDLSKELHIISADSFFEGKAKVLIGGTGISKYVYINKNGEVISTQYLKASRFYNNRAIVETKNDGWQMINEEFKCIASLPDFHRMEDLLSAYDEAAKLFNYNITARLEENQTLINPKTGYSIYVPGILRELANHFNISLIDDSIEKQIVYLVGEIAKKGNYIYDIETGVIEKAEFVKGIQISDENDVKITSFDKKDISLIRKKEKEGRNE